MKTRQEKRNEASRKRNEASRKWKQDNWQRVRDYNAQYYSNNQEDIKDQQSEYRHRTRKECRDRQRNSRTSNPEKHTAHRAVADAVKNKDLQRPDHCEECNEAAIVHGHHADYSKPLDVTWLCPLCHNREHARLLREGIALRGLRC